MNAKLLGLFLVLLSHYVLPLHSEDRTVIRQIKNTVKDKELLIYGEASHGLRSNHEFACRLFKTLVQDCGYRILFLETVPSIHTAFWEYVRLGKTIHPFYLNAFYSDSVKKLLLWAREYNRMHPDDPVQICGFQPEQPVTDLQTIKAATGIIPPTLDSVFACSDNLQLLMRNASRFQENKEIYTPWLRERMSHELSSVAVNDSTRLALESLKGYIQVLTYWIDRMTTEAETQTNCARNLYQQGDSVRMNLLAFQKDKLYRNQKAMVWMQNWHAMKNSQKVYGNVSNGHPPVNTRSLGYRLARKYRSVYFLGTVTPMYLPDTTIPASIDRQMARTFGNKAAFIPLAESGIRTTGTLSSPNDSSLLHQVQLAEQFDGIIYLPQN